MWCHSNELHLVLACLLCTACQSTPAKPAPVPGVAASGISNSVLAATDPCALRMDDIRVAMLQYLHAHDRLPEKIEDLQQFAEPGTQLQFTCPASGKAYVYVPAGLTVPGKDQRLVLYDAAPAHEGQRWSVMLAPPQDGRALITWIAPLDQPTLDSYLRSAAPPAH
jgi:hypothetical protein